MHHQPKRRRPTNSTIILISLWLEPNPVSRVDLVKTYNDILEDYFGEETGFISTYRNISRSLAVLKCNSQIKHPEHNEWEITKAGIGRLRYLDAVSRLPPHLSKMLRESGIHDYYISSLDDYKFKVGVCSGCNKIKRIERQEHDDDFIDISFVRV